MVSVELTTSHQMVLAYLTLSLPNEDFGKRNKRWNQDFRRKHFSMAWVLENHDFIFCSELIVPRSKSVWKDWPSQMKMLEGWTKDDIRSFEALFKGVSTRFGLRTIEKSIENTHVIFCQSFQNLRLGSIKMMVLRLRISPAFPLWCFLLWGA